MNASITVVIPTYNERENIAPLVRRIHELLCARQHEILVVDDFSPDGTSEVVGAISREIPELRLLSKSPREGIGAALRFGYDQATGDIIVSSDADFSFDPADILRLIAAVESGADLALGARHVPRGGYETPRLAVWLKFLFSRLGNQVVKRVTGLAVHDYSANFRAIRSQVWRDIKTRENSNSLLLEMILKVARQGGSIVEIPVIFSDRRYGKSKLNLWIEASKFLFKLLYYSRICRPGAPGRNV